MFNRPFSQGTSVLAALVFVAILGTVAYGVSAISPNTRTLGQSASGVLAIEVKTTAAAPAAAPAAKNDSPVKLNGAARCNAPIDQKKNKSTASASAEGVAGVDNVCVPGCQYTVQKDTGSVNAEDTCSSLPAGTVTQQKFKAQCEKTKKCVVQICSAPGKCEASMTGSNAENALGKAAQIPAYLKSDQAILDALNKARSGQDPTADINKLPSWYQDAFKEAKADEQAQVADALAANKEAQRIKQEELERATNYGSPNQRVIDRIQSEQKDLKDQEAALKQQQQNLDNVKAIGADKVDLTPKLTSCKSSACADGEIDRAGAGKLPPVAPKLPPADPRKESTFPGPGEPQPQPSSSGGLGSALQSILGGLAKALGGAAAGTGAPCPSDPNAYAQQQQQYNQQLQQYNLQLQQYNYQQQMNQLNGLPAPIPPQPPSQCTPNSSSNTCATPPAQPSASSCANGTWKPITTQQSNGASCTTSWQCVPGGSGVTPTAQISCQPKVADVGMSVAITFGCTNATDSVGSGGTFSTGGATSGSTTTVITTPPDGANGVNFGIQCRNQGLVGQAQCSVQIGKPSIVLLANPKIVPVNTASSVGWVTASMQSCVVSSPDLPEFTAQNANNKSVNGMATTTPLTQDTQILLHCITVGGNTKDATTTIQIATSTTP